MKDTRIEFRSSPMEKDLLMLAAQLTGVNVSVFLRNAALEIANKIIRENETIKLSNRDRDLFLKLLEQSPEPTTELKKAVKEYKHMKSS